MSDKRILFGKFEFPRLQGLKYLLDEGKPTTDYLFVNDPNERFSMYFEKDFPKFTLPERSDREYCFFEMNQKERRIRFFCPERKKNLDSVVWYFHVMLFDKNGDAHELPGQVRVELEGTCFYQARGKPKFIEVLEQVKLKPNF